MKIKFWNLEYDFDRDDAKIVVPIALLVIAISVTSINATWLLGMIAAYYLLYFFSGNVAEVVRIYIARQKI